jgi:hypothetical protein
VAEAGVVPGCAGMAEPAVGGKPGTQVVGFSGIAVVILVTVEAILCQAAELIVFMAFRTVQYFMGSGQGVAGFLLVDPGPGPDYFPVMGRMAISTMETQLEIIAVIFFPYPVAGLALAGRSLENPVYMTITAGHGSMLADQGEVGLVMGVWIPFLSGVIFRVKIKHQQYSEQQRRDKGDGSKYSIFLHPGSLTSGRSNGKKTGAPSHLPVWYGHTPERKPGVC